MLDRSSVFVPKAADFLPDSLKLPTIGQFLAHRRIRPHSFVWARDGISLLAAGRLFSSASECTACTGSRGKARRMGCQAARFASHDGSLRMKMVQRMHLEPRQRRPAYLILLTFCLFLQVRRVENQASRQIALS